MTQRVVNVLPVPTFKTTSKERFEIQRHGRFIRVIATSCGEQVYGTMSIEKAEAFIANPPANETR